MNLRNDQLQGRLTSLDAFRGATMALMVLVNNAGDGNNSYAPLQHSQWNGWTITDVVFPTFLFIVGIAITLSLGSRIERGLPKSSLILPVVRRSLILYALGLLVYLYPHFDFSTMRVMGVLQRIGICYLIASLIYLQTSGRTGWMVACIGLLLASYWLLMTLVPVPGFGAGRLDVEGNLAHYVDRVVLGTHNYRSTKTWDPEGIVSTLPAIATALFGVLAGGVLRAKRTLWERMTILFVIGNALLAAGLICNIWLPINKKLWTSSFCLFMAGLAYVLLAMFVYFVDERGCQRWFKPFVILGRNAIVIYMLSELLATSLDEIKWREASATVSLQEWLYRTIFVPLASPANSSLLWALAFTALMFVAAYFMYRRNWIVRI
jgi:predicted acyltransferase